MSAPRCDDQHETHFDASKTSESRLIQIDTQSEFISDAKSRLSREPQSVESSDESQVHGRKMLRRVANRRSAQQSRARKKALMGDLKIENARLQKLADILDSQPELTFCIDISGNIQFISEKALNSMKSTVPEDSDDEPSHINQILTMESVQTVLESVAEVRGYSSRNKFNYQDYLDGCTSSVQSVCYHDANGFQVAGYIRCSRLIKRVAFDDGESTTITETGPAVKKGRASSPTNATCTNSVDQLSNPSSKSSIQNANCSRASSVESGSEVKSRRGQHQEEEFVCVIRPADASFPCARGSRLFSTLLSTASMVAHDLELRSSGYNNQVDPLAAGWSKEDYHAAGRLGAPYAYNSSGQTSGSGSGSGSSNGTKNSTSSETNSEDNGEHDDSPL